MGRAALIVSAGILLSRALGYVRDAVMAGVLGAGTEADIYVAAFLVPDILFYLMAGGYLSITFIPILSRHIANDDEVGQWESFASVAKPITIAMIAITAIAMAFANQLVDLVFISLPAWLDSEATVAFGPAELAEITHLTRIVLPAQIFFMLGSLLAAVQYARQRFALPSLAPLVYNISIIAGGLVGPTLGAEGAAGFAWGALIGAGVGNFGLQLYGARKVGLIWVRKASWRAPVVGEYLRLALPLMLGQSVAVLDVQFIPIFGQTLGDAAISQLYFARRLNMFPVGIIAQAAGVAAYPYLARLAEEGKLDELSATLTRALRYTIYAGFAATAAVLATSTPAVRVAYQHGNFDTADTKATALALFVFCLSIPLWGAHQVYSRGFYARRKMWVPVGIGTLWMAIGTVIYWQLVGHYGQAGLATASVITMAGYTLHLGVTWHVQTGRDPSRSVLKAFGRSGGSAVIAAAVGWYAVSAATGPAESMTLTQGLVGLMVGALVVGILYVTGTTLTGGTELKELRVARQGRGD